MAGPEMRATEPSIGWKEGDSTQTPGCQCTGPIVYGYRKALSLYLTPAKSNAQFSFAKSPPEIFNHKPSLISTCRKGSIIIYPGLNDWCVLVCSSFPISLWFTDKVATVFRLSDQANKHRVEIVVSTTLPGTHFTWDCWECIYLFVC